MKKALLFTLTAVMALTLFSCNKKEDKKAPADISEQAPGNYTIVYEPTFEQMAVANYDFSDRIIATNKSDGVSDDKTVNELDFASTLRFTGIISEQDEDKTFVVLHTWYVDAVKPKAEISYEAVTFDDAAKIVKLYADAYRYAVTPEQIDSIFSQYDKKETLTHKDFKVVIAKLTKLFNQAGFKFDFNADEVSKIAIIPSLMECAPVSDDGGLDLEKAKEICKERTVTITDKTEVEKELEFLKNVKVLDVTYIDSTITGDSYGYVVYGNDGNEILNLALKRDNLIYLNNVFYTLEDGSFEQRIQMVAVEK